MKPFKIVYSEKFSFNIGTNIKILLLQFALDWFFGIDLLYSNLIFACLNLVAVTVFLEFWKRRLDEADVELLKTPEMWS